jgi:hypothetical protein
MTIAFGFRSRDGWILAADSQETVSDYSKTATRKIRLIEVNTEWRIAYVGAGHGSYIDMLQWQIEKSCQSATDFNFDVAERIINAEVLSLHKKHIWPRQRADKPEIHTLILVQQKKEVFPVWDAMRMFATCDSAVVPIEDYHAIGIGAHMADYLEKIRYRVLMKTEAAERVAIYVLKEIKESINGCGDKSIVCFVSADGSFRFTTPSELEPIEKSCEALNDALQEIFKICLDPEHVTFETDLRIVNKILTDVRNKQVEVKSARDLLYQEIRKGQLKVRGEG